MRKIIANVSELGEKYDSNLLIVSELVLQYCERGHMVGDDKEKIGKVT